jgi:hypothetical protein
MDLLAYQFLERLNAGVKRKVTVTLIGGNALVALKVKDQTRDVDLVVRSTEPEVAAFCREYFKKYKVKAEFFVDGLFVNVRVKDYLIRALPLEMEEFPNLTIKILDIYDVILTKTLRFSSRDQEDIANALMRININSNELEKRFKYYLKHFLGPKEDFINKHEILKKMFQHLLK